MEDNYSRKGENMMKTMQEYAKAYQHENRNKGKVVKINDYSFVFEKNPTKDGKVESFIVCLSWFCEL